MSIIEQVNQLEKCLQDLNQKCRLLQQENDSLRETQQFLKAQCEELFKKNEIAKKKVEQILGQLTKLEVYDD
jgi:uncharacterized protein (TIGR02449 family)